MPELSCEGVLAASCNARDAVAYSVAVGLDYAESARRVRAAVHARLGIEKRGRSIAHPAPPRNCSTEPLKPWLQPLVANVSDGLHFSQSIRGEILGGIGNDRVPEGADQRSSARFPALYARALPAAQRSQSAAAVGGAVRHFP